MPKIYGEVASLDFDFKDLRAMPLPDQLLMCDPSYFEVIDVKNPFMQGNAGKIDRPLARRQWDELKTAFGEFGVKTHTIPSVPNLEDMVFAANPVFLGLSAEGKKICVESHMRHESRRREVPHYARWFENIGYEIHQLPNPAIRFEGGGDAIWHPGRGVIWGGVGPRTEEAAYLSLATLFSVPVMALTLPDERFYHLDTCFAAVNESTVVIFPPAFTDEGRRLIKRGFETVIEVDANEANRFMACNLSPVLGKAAVVQRGAEKTAAALRGCGFAVKEVETSEFMKSGGSAYCLKMMIF